MLLLLDNRDSFTWNLAQAVAELGTEVDVRRSDAITWREAQALAPDAILIGPGPGTPERAGASLDVLRELAGSVPILGVCLGHQAIAVAYGGRVVRAARLAHGRALPVHHTGAGVFAGLPSPSWFTLYNSLVVDAAAVPDCLAVTAWSEDGEVMGLRHRSLDVEGVQFHPESILSENGLALLGNFLGRVRAGS